MIRETAYQDFLEFYLTLPISELRRRQDLCSQQIRIAHDKRMTRSLEQLHVMQAALQGAVWEIAFGEPLEGQDS